jgi:CubicO group peptidase (beta-lactamase class C family)
MKNLILWVSLCLSMGVQGQNLYFPPLIGPNWDTITPSSLGWCQRQIDSLYQFLDATNSKAFILLKEGKIVLEKYFDNHSRDSLWYWASAGKTLTAFTVGVAQQEGWLTISDTSSKYLGQGWTVCPPVKEEKITIWNQLTMTSGLNDAVPDHYCTLDSCLQYLTDAGNRWAYHNGPYTLLDGVISGATNQSLNTYFNSKVRNRIGMNGAYFQSGYNNVYVSNARSMARFGLLMLNKGNWNGNTILSDSTYFNQMINTSQNLNLSYGYLWWLNGKSSFMVPTLQNIFNGFLFPQAPADTYAALGRDGQIINVVPSQKIVFIRRGEAPGTNSDVTITYNDQIWEKLNQLNCLLSNQSIDDLILEIFPNPFHDFLQIKGIDPVQGARLRVLLFNTSGQKLIEKKLIGNSVSLDGLQARTGELYFINIQDEQGKIIHSQKLIYK